MVINTHGMTDLGYKIFLDRYALKDTKRKYWVEGGPVLARFDGKSEVATLWSVNEKNQTVVVSLSDIGLMQLPMTQVDLPTETNPTELWRRVAKAVAFAENGSAHQEHYAGQFEWLLEDWKFVPGGRIMSAAGAQGDLTYYNCFVLPSPHDSRSGIFKTLEQMTEVMSRGGGVGLNLSTLRPRGSYVQGVDGRSSGAVSWGSVYSHVTGLVEQGGTRRGALMLILADWHPDILEFIDSKREAGKVTNANISVAVSDALMKAVEDDADWELVFPDTSNVGYNTEWKGDIHEWKKHDGDVVVWKKIKARELWNKLVASAHASAEPGMWFIDESRRMSNSQHTDIGQLISTNPCGEQPLPAWGVCNLGAINLSKFVKNNVVEWDLLEKSVRLAVRFLDNVVTCTPYIFHQNEYQQKRERRVGLGTMGFADMLIQLGIRYGSQASLDFAGTLFEFIKVIAYDTSADLAKEKGAYPEWDLSALGCGFLYENFAFNEKEKSLTAKIINHGLRNSTILTQAPTGSTATMVNVSTGIEPYFALRWTRGGRLGEHEEKIALVEQWELDHPRKNLPSYFVTAHDLSPEDHVKMQATIQQHVDSAISKTCNVPHDWTVEQVDELYRLMYRLGCKGGTIYRDGSRDEQVLTVKELSLEAHKPVLVVVTEDSDIGPMCDLQGNCTTCQTA